MKHQVPVLALLTAGLTGCDSTRLELDLAGVSGAYIGTAPGSSLAVSTVSANLHVTVEESGFAHGLWILWGDTTTPTDPWEAVATGIYMGPRMVLEYDHPDKGRCHLNGPVSESSKYEPVRRCADAWDETDTLDLDFFPLWRGLVVRPEYTETNHPDGKYDSNSFGSVPSGTEDTIIDGLPSKGDSVYTPYSCFLKPKDGSGTDIEHMVAKREAHYSGRLTAARRKEFGKDLVNLTVADPAVNRDKGSHDTWQPERNRGWMAERIIRAKQKYHLSVDYIEQRVLAIMLEEDPSREVTCP